MNSKIALLVFILFTISCKEGKDDNSSKIKSLNDQSLQCIAIMNKAEEQKNAAIASNDMATVASMQKTMDSAAIENVKIGQQLMELQNKK